MATVAQALANVALLAIDTAPIIYFIEVHPQYDAVVTEIFGRIDDGRIQAVTSVISLIEVLVVPIRRGNVVSRQDYTNLLLSSRNFTTSQITSAIAVKAAELRSQHRAFIENTPYADFASLRCPCYRTSLSA